MYGSRSSREISTFESHELICSSVGGVDWVFNWAIKSEKSKELPSSGVVVTGVSLLTDVDKAQLLYAFRDGESREGADRVRLFRLGR